jgi:hypothetical protein
MPVERAAADKPAAPSDETDIERGAEPEPTARDARKAKKSSVRRKMAAAARTKAVGNRWPKVRAGKLSLDQF